MGRAKIERRTMFVDVITTRRIQTKDEREIEAFMTAMSGIHGNNRVTVGGLCVLTHNVIDYCISPGEPSGLRRDGFHEDNLNLKRLKEMQKRICNEK